MAIGDGLSVDCSNLQAVGGTRFIALREWVSTDAVVFDGSLHAITSIIDVGGVDASWGVYESRIESSSLTVTGTNEGKEFTTYECTVSWFIPGMSAGAFRKLYSFDGRCMMCMVINNNDATSGTAAPSATYASNYVIGVSNSLANQDNNARTQQYVRLVSIEGGTGAAFSDEIGVTVTVAATQMEIPRDYRGTIIIDAGGVGLKTS
jgi:hypothetical protein